MFGYGLDMGWMWLWGLLAVAGLVLLIFVIVRLITSGIKRNDTSGTSPGVAGAVGKSTARQILDERYANGELTTEEYRERLSVLGEDG